MRPMSASICLDDTLHDATHASMGVLQCTMRGYMASHFGLSEAESDMLRMRY